MSISINEIVNVLASRVGQPFSIPLQEELKRIVNYKRVNYMQQSMEKNPGQRQFYTQQVVVPLEQVDNENDICGMTTSTKCPILRTECEIPQPLRSSFALFDYVGQANFIKSFSMSSPELLGFGAHNTYTGKTEKWFYINNRLYIYNNLRLKYVGLRGVFENPEDVNSCCETTCYDENSSFPAPQDMINAIIRDILQVEMRQMFPEVEVEVDKEEVQSSPYARNRR